MRKINPSIQLPQYYSYIYENDFPSLKHILELLNEFIPSKLFYSEQFSFKEKNINQKNITWFDLIELETKLEESMSTDSSNLKVLKKISESEITFKKPLHIEHNIFDELLIKFPNFKDVIDYYNGSFRLKKLNEYYHIMPILLLGEPGIGKTYFSQVFSEKINTGFTFIDLFFPVGIVRFFRWCDTGFLKTLPDPGFFFCHQFLFCRVFFHPGCPGHSAGIQSVFIFCKLIQYAYRG